MNASACPCPCACLAAYSVSSQYGSVLPAESHLYFKQFAPNRRDKVEDAVFGTGKLCVINEQSKQEDIRSQSGEIHNLKDMVGVRTAHSTRAEGLS